MTQALQQDQTSLCTRISTASADGLRSETNPAGSARADAIVSPRRWYKILIRSRACSNGQLFDGEKQMPLFVNVNGRLVASYAEEAFLPEAFYSVYLDSRLDGMHSVVRVE